MNDTKADRPEYDKFNCMREIRAEKAANFAKQIIDTTLPFLSGPPAGRDVLDIGCGYGTTCLALCTSFRRIVGIEPSRPLFEVAQSLAEERGATNIEFRNEGIYDYSAESAFDLVILDNVFEHLPNQALALEKISRCLRPGGIAYILVPNKLWPMEVHYQLPFLSYLPLRIANSYLRFSGRGDDYTDASYAPTYFRMNRLLRARPEFTFQYVVPADISLATNGQSLHYRVGVAALRRCPWLWVISKAFMIVVTKNMMA